MLSNILIFRSFSGPNLSFAIQVVICRNEAEKCLIETSINSLRISLKVKFGKWLLLLFLFLVVRFESNYIERPSSITYRPWAIMFDCYLVSLWAFSCYLCILCRIRTQMEKRGIWEGKNDGEKKKDSSNCQFKGSWLCCNFELSELSNSGNMIGKVVLLKLKQNYKLVLNYFYWNLGFKTYNRNLSWVIFLA